MRNTGVQLEEPPEDDVEHEEEAERLDHRPHVAEGRARVLQLVLGVGDHLNDSQVVREARFQRPTVA